MESITKTFVVRGNNDKDQWGLTLPEYKEIEMDEVLIYFVHNKADIPKDLKEVDLVIYGHSHKFSNEKIDDIVYLNYNYYSFYNLRVSGRSASNGANKKCIYYIGAICRNSK